MQDRIRLAEASFELVQPLHDLLPVLAAPGVELVELAVQCEYALLEQGNPLVGIGAMRVWRLKEKLSKEY